MNTLELDYKIVAAHETLNRLLPLTVENTDRVAEVRQEIAALVSERKAVSNWRFPNFAELIAQSKLGRERLAVYPYPDNPHDWRGLRRDIKQRVQFFTAWAKLHNC